MQTFVIAVTRWSRPVQEEATALAPVLGGTAYDLRLKLTGPLPVIVGKTTDPTHAEHLLGVLLQRGHGAVACELSKVASSSSMVTPRDFVFADDRMVFSDPERGQFEVPYPAVVALIRAMHATSAVAMQTDRRRKLSASRAVLTGGLMPTKVVSKDRRSASDEREQVLYLFGPLTAPPLLLVEGRLRYTGLGDRMGATRLANFVTLVGLLRERAPRAFYDERLLTQRVRGTGDGAFESNVDATDLAAHLLTLACLGGHL